MMTIAPPTRPSGNAPNPHIPPALPPAPHVIAVLRAVVRKELHQNLPIAALVIALIVIVAGAVQLTGSTSHASENILAGRGIPDIITLGCILAALCFGLFQPFFDRNFDLWAFLVHRPVSRSTLFAGRAIAGLILYTCTIGLPLLALFLYAMSPYGGGIFLWQYTLPPIADFFAGVPFYFAGLLATERSARLYGSRALPLLAPIVAVYFTLTLPWFWAALLISLALAALLALAADASALSHGYTLHPPRRGKIALVLSFFLGIALLTGTIGENIRPQAASLHQVPPPSQRIVQDSYTITDRVAFADGTLGIRIQSAVRNPKAAWDPGRFNPLPIRYTDLAGHPLDNPTLVESVQNRIHFAASNVTTHYRQPRSYREFDELTEDFDLNTSPPGYQRRAFWLTRQNLFCIYQYQKNDEGVAVGPREFVGILGANGLTHNRADAHPFNTRYISQFPFIHTPRTLYYVNTADLSVHTLYAAPADDEILALQRSFVEPQPGRRQYTALIVTYRHILMFDNEGRILQQLPVTQDLHHQTLEGDYLPDAHRWILHYYVDSWPPKPLPNTWEIYDDSAKLLATHEFKTTFESTETYEPTPPGLPSQEVVNRVDAEAGALLALRNPLAAILMDYLHRPLVRPYQRDPIFWLPFFNQLAFPYALLPFAAILLLTLLLTAALARLYRLPHAWPWLLLALLCGPATLVILPAVNTLPSRTRCPSCKHLRPLNQPLCPHCNSPFPTPPHTGTEIFTPATPAAPIGGPA